MDIALHIEGVSNSLIFFFFEFKECWKKLFNFEHFFYWNIIVIFFYFFPFMKIWKSENRIIWLLSEKNG